jgi:hypothetical protein
MNTGPLTLNTEPYQPFIAAAAELLEHIPKRKVKHTQQQKQKQQQQVQIMTLTAMP